MYSGVQLIYNIQKYLEMAIQHFVCLKKLNFIN